MHEFVHYLDDMRYSDTYKFKYNSDDKNYYNSPEEYNSYTHEIVNFILNKKELLKLPFIEFLRVVFSNRATEIFVDNLTESNLKRLKKRLYKLYTELNKQ